MLKQIKRGTVSRVGATTAIIPRLSSYKSEGYSGTADVARTTNMKAAENHLLKAGQSSKRSCNDNVQKSSNVPAKPGYVYAIKGKKK